MSESPSKIEKLPASWQSNLREKLRREFGDLEILLTTLSDESGAIAIFPVRVNQSCNAQIIEKTGETRCSIEIPGDLLDGIGFHDAYYVAEELTAIFVTKYRDFACVIDEKSGKIIRSYETR